MGPSAGCGLVPPAEEPKAQWLSSGQAVPMLGHDCTPELLGALSVLLQVPGRGLLPQPLELPCVLVLVAGRVGWPC